jgi:hypothetical protein
MLSNKQISRHQSVSVYCKAALSGFLLVGFSAHGQSIEKHGDEDPNVSLHVAGGIHMCNFDIAPALTQGEWKQATREVGNAIYLEPLASSRPLGKGNWGLQLEQTSFHVDQESGAWNNIFHHPDSTHYLTGSNGRLAVPGLRFRLGITDKIDAGVYYTTAKPFGAKYGFLGFDMKYAFLNNTEKGWSAAARVSYVMDANIRDFNISSTGFEVMAGKKLFKLFTPYAGLATNWNYGRERTSEVNLHNESSLAVRGIIGLEFRWKFIDLTYECQLGDGMSQRSLKIGVVF